MGNRLSHVRELFDKLDHGKKGYLALSDLLAEETSIPILCHSPIIFYKFDSSSTGVLMYDDFLELITYVKELQKRSEKLIEEKKKEKQNQQILTKIRSISMSSDIVDKPSAIQAGFNSTDLRSATPILSSPETSSNSPMPQTTPSASTTPAIQDTTLLWSLFDKEMQNYLSTIVNTIQIRKSFVNWLFLFVDIKHKNQVDVEDLECLLSALKDDSITVENLLCEGGDELPQNLSDEAKKFLSKEEFMPLADLIIRNYQAKMQTSDNNYVGEYELRRKLGEGSEGCVRLAVNRRTGERKAHLENEISAMRKLNHVNIVHLEEVLEGDDMLYFVMELCPGGSLADHVAIAPFSLPVARYFFKQLLAGVQYCHAQGVVHRDLKLENLILDRSGVHMKICDFGHSSLVFTDWDYVQSAVVGSLYHIAPEQIGDSCYRAKNADVWSVGVILCRMLTGKFPFYSKNPLEAMNLIKNAVYTLPETLPRNVHELISSIFVIDPEQRATIDQIASSSFVASDVCMPLSFQKRTIIIDSGLTTVDNAWSVMHTILDEHDIVCKKSIRNCYLFHCYSITQQMKFIVAVRVGSDGSSNAYFEFVMTDGAGIDFRNFIDVIRDCFLESIDDIQFVSNERKLDALLLEGCHGLLASFRKAYEEMSFKHKVSVLLCGRSGCGKTSIANRFFSKKMLVNCNGNLTKYYTKYVHPHKPITLYDSKGIEINGKNEFWSETRNFLDAHKGADRIHCVWYVVDASMARFETIDEEICRTLFDVPIIIIVNKADLITPEELQKFKNKIESFKFNNCVGVISTVSVTTDNSIGPMATKQCTRCKGTDVCLFVKQCILFCNECGYEQSVTAQTNVDEYNKVIDSTLELVPDVIKCAFVSSQSLSIAHKVDTSKKMLLEYYGKLGDDTTQELKRVLRLLTRLNKLWDLADLHSLRIASKVIENITASENAGEKIWNFFSPSPTFQPNEFTAVSIVWVQCLLDFHYFLITEVANCEKRTELDDMMKTALEQSFSKLNKPTVEEIYERLTKKWY
ncbi:non-specific serine/threonine protein kinase [Entamoeba marina]